MESRVSLEFIGKVIEGRAAAVDDYWGNEKAVIELEATRFDASAIAGLDTFSHIEVIYYFNQVDPKSIVYGSSHPRGNPAWPRVGIFAQRKKDRPNQIGVSICKLDKVEDRKIFVTGLDAIAGTPVLDIKPVIRGFVPDRAQLKEPEWATELMANYFKLI